MSPHQCAGPPAAPGWQLQAAAALVGALAGIRVRMPAWPPSGVLVEAASYLDAAGVARIRFLDEADVVGFLPPHTRLVVAPTPAQPGGLR